MRTMATTPEHAVDVINERFGRHPRRRALHAKGLFCAGTFTASPAAAELTRAAHLQGAAVPVRARVSNGGGDPNVPDYEPDVRGLAVKFELPDGSSTDISAQSIPRVPIKTVDRFLDLVALSKPSLRTAARFPLFVARGPGVLSGIAAAAGAMKPAASYATIAYYGIHAFRWLDADGGERYVRYTWQPGAGEQRLSGKEAKALGRDYLQSELRERVAAGPVRFTLSVQIAAPTDRTDDPSAVWPSDRRRVDAGVLELTEAIEDPEADGSVVVFDPGRLTDGIELSEDPLLRFRPSAYSESVKRRTS
jgi:catalase